MVLLERSGAVLDLRRGPFRAMVNLGADPIERPSDADRDLVVAVGGAAATDSVLRLPAASAMILRGRS